MKKIISSSLCLATTLFLAFSLTGCSLESDVIRGAKRSSKSLSEYLINPSSLVYSVMYWVHDATTKTIYYYCEFDGTDSEGVYTEIYDPAFMEWERGKATATVYFYEDDLYSTIYTTFDTLWNDPSTEGAQFTEAEITSILEGANL